MPSPFPGFNPYLEAPDIWPDLRDGLAAKIRAELNRTLPRPYYARLEMRPEIGIVDAPPRRGAPDVTGSSSNCVGERADIHGRVGTAPHGSFARG